MYSQWRPISGLGGQGGDDFNVEVFEWIMAHLESRRKGTRSLKYRSGASAAKKAFPTELSRRNEWYC